MTDQITPRRLRVALVIATVVLLTALAAVAAWKSWSRPEPEPTGYVPPAHDALAQDASDFDPDLPALNAGEYVVSMQPDMRVDAGGSCEIWFRNPQDNPCHLMLDVRLIDSGLLIYRTGLVAPGEGIRAIQFVPDALAAMREGGQDVQLTVRSLRLDDYVNLGDVNLNTQLTYSP